MMPAKSLHWNVITNYTNLTITIVAGLIISPIYLNYLGGEGLGIIGFLGVLQAWTPVISLGLPSLLSRQIAGANGQSTLPFASLKQLLHCIELSILLMATTLCVVIVYKREWIVEQWLRADTLGEADAHYTMAICGIILAANLFITLYRNGINGTEHQVLLNLTSILLTVVKLIGAFTLLVYFTANIAIFFVFLLAHALLELCALVVVMYYTLPDPPTEKIKCSWKTLSPLMLISLSIAYSAGLTIFITQFYKTLLSGILSLQYFGFFTLAAIVASLIPRLASPLTIAVIPRMVNLLASGQHKSMLLLYRQTSQFIAVIIFPLSGTIALFSQELLFAWTGDQEASMWSSPILLWLSLGSGLYAINRLQYILHFTRGNLKNYIYYNTIVALIHTPIIIYTAYRGSVETVALSWFSIQLLSFLVWPAMTLNRMIPSIYRVWLIKDISIIFIASLGPLIGFYFLEINFFTMDRLTIFFTLGLIGLTAFLSSALLSEFTRRIIKKTIERLALKLKAK